MAKFQVLDGKAKIFATDDEGVFRSFLRHPGANNPTLSLEVRTRISVLAAKLPENIPAECTVREAIGDVQKDLQILIGHKPWRGPGS